MSQQSPISDKIPWDAKKYLHPSGRISSTTPSVKFRFAPPSAPPPFRLRLPVADRSPVCHPQAHGPVPEQHGKRPP